ncbi:MAG: EamA family transporter [Rhodobacterales bacterium 32-66-7]|nr:MAG: EamA family transporter [Rhodobacterales bacterium 32-66-7]
MRLVLLTALALTAFAANSVLNRFAVGMGQIDPVSFAVVRLLAGAAMLAVLVGFRSLAGGVVWPGWPGRLAGVLGLTFYLFAFSLAYVALDAGAGALILFGAVQITMFGGALLARDVVPRLRWAGAGMAFSGLVVLLWPGMGVPLSLPHAVLMAGAGVGFGVYSLAGRRAGDPLAGTAWNFVLSVPLGLAAGLALGVMPAGTTGLEVLLAVVSGAVTSGLGYAIWYSVVPALGSGRAAVAQLSVPVLTALAGIVFLGEAVDARFIAAAAFVLGGVALASRS